MKILHRMTAAILAVFLGVLCTGCHKAERPQAQPVNIAFLLGVADNETKVNENIEELASLPERPGTTYAFISADGAPTCIGEPGTIVDLSQRGYTDTMMERVRAGIKADLMTDLNTYVPSSPQIDLAGAIQMGVRQLRANAVEGRDNVLVLYTSGKSCAGLINLAETPVYRLDIQASVPGLAAEMGEDMSFVDRLVWYCCGDFAGEEQQPLSSAEQNKLREFYKELFVALGMKESNIQFRDDLPQTECYQFDETPVSCIEVADAAYDLAELSPNLLEMGMPFPTRLSPFRKSRCSTSRIRRSSCTRYPPLRPCSRWPISWRKMAKFRFCCTEPAPGTPTRTMPYSWAGPAPRASRVFWLRTASRRTGSSRRPSGRRMTPTISSDSEPGKRPVSTARPLLPMRLPTSAARFWKTLCERERRDSTNVSSGVQQY